MRRRSQPRTAVIAEQTKKHLSNAFPQSLQPQADTISPRRHFIMCPPTEYRIDYSINAWMRTEDNVDTDRASHQWQSLVDTYRSLGADVTVIPPVAGLSERTFPGDSVFVYKNHAVVGRFRFPERTPEEQPMADTFSSLGFQVHRLPAGMHFEGNAEAVLWNGMLLGGFGVRSDRSAYDHIQQLLGLDVVALELIEPFFHFDISLCPLGSGYLAYFPAAFSPDARRKIRSLSDKLIEVDEDEARLLALNSVQVGEVVVMSSRECPKFASQLLRAGFQTIELDLSEFRKAGGGAKCLTLERYAALGRLHGPSEPVERRQPKVQRRQRILQSINRDLILQAPLVSPDPENFRTPKGTEVWTSNLRGEAVSRIIIYLRSDVGCEFGLKTGGCTGCRHWRLGTAGKRVPGDDLYVHQFLSAIEERGLHPVVCIYNEGNMLNEFELPQSQLRQIVRHLASYGVRRLVLESRPEHITDATLAPLRDAASDMEIEIGIGLESANDFIRNELFLKAMTLEGYEKSVERLKRHGMRALAYVILKPAFLNEAQAVSDAIATARYAFGVGTDAVSFEPIGVEPHTITEVMYREGAFKPAWLWTVLKVVEATHPMGETRIGGFQFSPLPVHLPKNCNLCTTQVLRAIDEYNLTYDITRLNVPHCPSCYPKYVEELNGQSSVIDTVELEGILRVFVSRHSGTLRQQSVGAAAL